MPKPRFSAAIFDSSSLIVVAKLDAIADWRAIYERLLVPPGVEQECIGESVPQGSEDALRIENALQVDALKRITLTAAQLKQANEWHAQRHLGIGECQTLAYTHTITNVIAVIEDKRARSFARLHQIPYTTIQLSPLEGYIRKKISYARAALLTERIASAMHSDLALLNTLQFALKALAAERGEINGSNEN